MLALPLSPTISALRGGPRSGTSPAHGLPSPPSAPAKAPASAAAPASFPLAAPSAPIPAGSAGASARGPTAARAALAVPASVADAADLDTTAEAAGAGPVRRPTLEAIENDGMIENARAIEHHLRVSLSDIDGILGIRGKGCLLGIEFRDNCAPIHSKLIDKKIITGTSSDPKVLRLLPPLSTRTEEIDLLIDALCPS